MNSTLVYVHLLRLIFIRKEGAITRIVKITQDFNAISSSFINGAKGSFLGLELIRLLNSGAGLKQMYNFSSRLRLKSFGAEEGKTSLPT